MSLYGALYAGVAGIRSQGSKIGVISDNIANVNTVGYKQAQAQFETLVTNSGGTYSPGGVISTTRQQVDQQGLIQTTNASTDIAIAGKGFFAVNAASDGSNEPLYTRAGSFRQDNLGNFVNASGYYLQGWPLDRDGRLPGEPGNLNSISSANLDSLETVNVQSASGVASSTTTVSIGANLNAGEVVFPGAAGVADLDAFSASPNNFNIAGDDIIVSNEFGAAPTNSLVRGDSFDIATGNGLAYSFEYGGFAIGRNVTTAGAGNVGDGGRNTAATAYAGATITTNGTTTVTINLGGAHSFAVNDVMTLAGISATVDGITPAMLNGPHVVTAVVGNSVSFVVGTAATGSTAAGAAGGSTTAAERSYGFVGNILDATAPTQTLLGVTGTSPFTTAGLAFTISVGGETKIFTYTSASPNLLTGQFNTLSNLTAAIDAQSGLTARLVEGRLYVGSENGTDALVFANGDAVGTGGLAGIDWIRELDLSDVAFSATPRFSSLQSLAALANASPGLSAKVDNPLSNASLSLNVDDPLDTIRFQDASGNTGALLKEMGFALASAGDTGILGPKYNPGDSAANMASGAIVAQFSRNVRVYDAQGSGHDMRMSFIKVDVNKWAVEVHIIPPTDITTSLVDGQVATGTIEFNGDGTLRAISSEIAAPFTIGWTNGALPSIISYDWGTAGAPFGTSGASIIGQTDGLSQFNADYKVNFVDQNGAQVGELTSVTIDEEGFVIASYSNGETQRVYKLPIADFSNPNGLKSISGNVFAQTRDSGEVNLREAGENGTGKMRSASLEASNVELAEQLTDMIVAQRAYQANTRVIKTSDELLEQLNQL